MEYPILIYLLLKLPFLLGVGTNWLKKFTRVSLPTCIKWNFDWSLALVSCLVQTELRLRILPFFRGHDVFGDRFTKVCFLGNGIGLQGQGWPKLQDLNTNSAMSVKFLVALRFLVRYLSRQFPWHPPSPRWTQWVCTKKALSKLCYFL